MTICPCCGVKSVGYFNDGCNACGAQSVGEPLPRPEHELPSYGRALVLVAMSTSMVGMFVGQLVLGFLKHLPGSFSFSSFFWSFANAGQTAAWRIKWGMIPATMLVLVAGRKLYTSILSDADRFCGERYARQGLRAAVAVCILTGFFLVVSVPGRLENRRLSIEAGYYAHVHRLDRAFLEYGIRYHTLPSDPQDLLKGLPDPDGSLAAALNEREIGPLGPGAYKPSGSDLAALPQRKPRPLQGLVIRNASVDAPSDDALPAGWSLTNYELRLAGPDKIVGTEDDLIVRDGVITKASEAGPGVIGSTASSNALKR